MSWAEKIYANTLFVADIERSKAFYAQILEKSPIFEDEASVVFQFGELLINLLSQKEAIELITPAKVASLGHGSSSQMTIQVHDVDAHARRLGEMGVTLINGPIDRPWGIRTVLFADPDGHLWELAH
jgi:catechol 2,3-dioxygenase-like lactoylglutathione lyase family enzyme